MSIEQEIQAKGLTAPRITLDDIEANIKAEYYFTAEEGAEFSKMAGRIKEVDDNVALSLLTFCVLVLKNGFTVPGQSACASPENFDAAIGRQIAREKAIEQVWPLLGYELRSQLAAVPVDSEGGEL